MIVAAALLLAPVMGIPVQSVPAKHGQQSNAGSDEKCPADDSADIVVCAERKQPYRLDPDIRSAEEERARLRQSMSTTLPPAQASCSTSPMGCGKGLEGLDLLNVGLVTGTVLARAAKGDDWAKSFKVGGPDEYQLYLKAKREREERREDVAAKKVQAAARAASRTR